MLVGGLDLVRVNVARQSDFAAHLAFVALLPDISPFLLLLLLALLAGANGPSIAHSRDFNIFRLHPRQGRLHNIVVIVLGDVYRKHSPAWERERTRHNKTILKQPFHRVA